MPDGRWGYTGHIPHTKQLKHKSHTFYAGLKFLKIFFSVKMALQEEYTTAPGKKISNYLGPLFRNKRKRKAAHA